MAQQLIPNIGDKGLWTAVSPYAETLSPAILYECVGVRKLAEVIAAGEDAYSKYYQPYGATLAEYVADAQSGVCMVSLVAGNGQWRYIPSNRLKSVPSMAGVKYSRVVLGISLGELAEEMDLSPLSAVIAQAVHHYLAITPVIHLTVASATSLVSTEDHAARMGAIAGRRALTKTDYTRCVELTAEVQSLRSKLLMAEQYILAHR